MIEIVKSPVTFIKGDNIEYLRKCKEEMKWKYFHLGIVDPPYGISVGSMNLGSTKNSKPRDFEMGDWDNEIPTQEYWNLLWYCCRNLIVWGGNYFVHNFGQTVSPYSPDKHTPITSGRCFVVWDKMNDKMSFAPAELALTTFDRNAVMIRRPRNKKTDDEGDKRHPTQKPVYLYDYLHLQFVEKGQRVLDTHGGSFSHAIAAYKNNVNLTIIDKNENYINAGIEAFEKATVKGRLLF